MQIAAVKKEKLRETSDNDENAPVVQMTWGFHELACSDTVYNSLIAVGHVCQSERRKAALRNC